MKFSILAVFNKSNSPPSKFSKLFNILSSSKTQRPELKQSLERLEHTGHITRSDQDYYTPSLNQQLIEGRIQITLQGRGFVQPDTSDYKEIAIPASQTGTALHGDHVQVKLTKNRQSSRSRTEAKKTPTGSVVAITKRNRIRFVGTLEHQNSTYQVSLDDPRIPHIFHVPRPKKGKKQAKHGDKVIVELSEWKSARSTPQGIITEVLGHPDGSGVDMLSVLRQYDLSSDFPKSVLKEVKRLGTKVSEDELKGRTDCRSHPVITIDPADAKDFDDAFSLTRSGENRWKLSVHIADVSHYVKPDSAIDKEAKSRANSTYLVDRVVPMLPEALSNHLCSLIPRVDRLTKCVEFLIDDDGQVLRSRFYSAVIHSKQRYSYEQAMEVIKNTPKAPLEHMLHGANQLASKIRARRIKAGSLDMDFSETKIYLDDQGCIKNIETVDYDESHQLIEEFMLLANESVARHLQKLNRPSLHRVHEDPDGDRLAEYSDEVRKHGIQCGNLTKTSEVQKLFQRLNQLPIGQVLKIGFMKSLMKARYSSKPEGHYGLAKSFYTHFTSPIRRYADLVIHRSLFGEKQDICMDEIALHITSKERNSADAERDSKNLKLFAFLNTQLETKNRQRYTSLVTEVRNIGISVNVPALGLRGMIPFSLLKDDYYKFDPAKNIAKGQRNGRTFRVADQVHVVVAKVDTEKHRIDFSIPPQKQLSQKATKKRRPRRHTRKKATVTPA